MKVLRTLSNNDDDGSENITKKGNLRPFKLYRVYWEPLNSSNVGDFSWSWILKGFTLVQIEKRKFVVVLSTSFIKRRIGRFYVVVMQCTRCLTPCSWNNFMLFRVAFSGATCVQLPGASQVVHTDQPSCRCGWPWGFGALNSSPHSWIFTSVSVGSSPRSFLFTSATDRTGVHTAPKYSTKAIRYVTLHRHVARHLRSVTAEFAPPQCINRFWMWTEALSSMIFVAGWKLSAIV